MAIKWLEQPSDTVYTLGTITSEGPYYGLLIRVDKIGIVQMLTPYQEGWQYVTELEQLNGDENKAYNTLADWFGEEE
jgi:hypothetical protein